MHCISDQIREEKKEDVFLLFQKIGCYKDDEVQHDLANPLTLKSISQEDCARACALEEKGYSFFGLQNSDQCYCGHRYGKYGKADDSMCNKKCRDNKDENCGGKSANVVYFFGLGKLVLMPRIAILLEFYLKYSKCCLGDTIRTQNYEISICTA